MSTSLMLNCAKKYLNFFLKKNPTHLIRQEMCVVSVICGEFLRWEIITEFETRVPLGVDEP